MMRYKSWTLTDVFNDLWLDNFTASNDSVRLPTCHDWSIRKRTLRGGLRDGIDLIEVHNGALSFNVLPTRGMGLWHGEYRGTFLGWQSPVRGPVHPKFVQLSDRGGLGWLTGFDEWLCRCGLAWNGPPGNDPGFGPISLHGRIANLPAHLVEVRINLDPPNELSVIGQIDEAGLFYPNLRLTTTYTTVPGSNRLTIHDVVENRSAVPTEIEMLYHCNVGPPFLEAGSRIIVPTHELAPQSARAAEGMETYDTYVGPTTGFAEQVYLYDVAADVRGHTLGLLSNARRDRGLVLRWNRQELPCFTVWKNCAAVEDGYVTGLEPGLNYPNIKTFERKQGRVKVLPPTGKWECSWSMEVHDTADGITSVLKEIAALQAHCKSQIHRTPVDRFSVLASPNSLENT
jgi:hypothetical protein